MSRYSQSELDLLHVDNRCIYTNILLYSYPKQSWTRFVTADTHSLASPETLDLLDKLLRYDHAERLTAHEAQSHVFFSGLCSSEVTLDFSDRLVL